MSPQVSLGRQARTDRFTEALRQVFLADLSAATGMQFAPGGSIRLAVSASTAATSSTAAGWRAAS
jgi:hypothetical protein